MVEVNIVKQKVNKPVKPKLLGKEAVGLYDVKKALLSTKVSVQYPLNNFCYIDTEALFN